MQNESFGTLRNAGTRKLGLFLSFLVSAGFMNCGDNNHNQATREDVSALKQSAETSLMAKREEASANSDSSHAQTSSPDADWLLIPGVSAGQTKIGDDADAVYRRLGKADGGDAAMQKAVGIWYSHHNSTGHSVAVYTSRNTDSPAIARVLQIRITSPSFSTRNGIHTTSSLADIQSIFTVKQTETYEDANANYKVYDSKDGIAFEMNSNNKCVAIIIHKAGVVGEGTYLKFRTTNKYIDNGKK